MNTHHTRLMEGEDTHPMDRERILTPSSYVLDLIARINVLIPLVDARKAKLYNCVLEGIENVHKKPNNPWGAWHRPYVVTGYSTLLKTIEADERHHNIPQKTTQKGN